MKDYYSAWDNFDVEGAEGEVEEAMRREEEAKTSFTMKGGVTVGDASPLDVLAGSSANSSPLYVPDSDSAITAAVAHKLTHCTSTSGNNNHLAALPSAVPTYISPSTSS